LALCFKMDKRREVCVEARCDDACCKRRSARRPRHDISVCTRSCDRTVRALCDSAGFMLLMMIASIDINSSTTVTHPVMIVIIHYVKTLHKNTVRNVKILLLRSETKSQS